MTTPTDAGFHEVMSDHREQDVEQAISDMIDALCTHMAMTPPSAVYALQLVSCRMLAHWNIDATIKNLRATARFMQGDLKYAALSKEQGKLFDQIAAGWERKEGAQNDV